MFVLQHCRDSHAHITAAGIQISLTGHSCQVIFKFLQSSALGTAASAAKVAFLVQQTVFVLKGPDSHPLATHSAIRRT